MHAKAIQACEVFMAPVAVDEEDDDAKVHVHCLYLFRNREGLDMFRRADIVREGCNLDVFAAVGLLLVAATCCLIRS